MDPSLSSERAGRLQALFDAAVDLDAAARPAYLDRACRDDSELRREVESLLAAFDAHAADVRQILERLPLAGSPPADAGSAESDTGGWAGRRIAHYEVLEKLGGGGMGVVYRALDEQLGRTVALKFLPSHLSFDEDAKRRFVQEARAASALDHANIGTIHEIGETASGQLFIAMAFYAGETLKKKIERGPLAVEEALDYAVQMAEGLGAAHRRGIVHRDVKPANVMVTDEGVARLVDFGLAKVADVSLTATGTTLGTVAYMSPEQARGEAVDHRTDLWSLGVVLYEMLAGQRPFRGDYEQAVLYAILNEDPLPVRTLRPEVSERLSEVVERLLRKEPEERYPDAAEVLADLRGLQVKHAAPARRARRSLRSGRRAPRRAVAAAVVGLVLAGTGLLLWLSRSASQAPSAGAAAAPPSIAVLPLTNLSGDPTQDYFADGMTGTLIANLAKIEGLRVISRTSVMRFKQTQTREALPEIARALNVDYVVEGSVLQAGDRVRITAQLIEAASDEHLWAEHYERAMQDVLALQGEVALAVARAVEAKLTPQEEARLSEASTVDPEAYRLYLQGLQARNRDTPEDWRRAAGYFEAAVARDAGFAEAYAGMALAYTLLVLVSREGNEARARWAMERALALDPELSEAYMALGTLRFVLDWDWPGAEAAFQRALALNPGNSQARHDYGFLLLWTGRFAEGLAQEQRAAAQDPLSPMIQYGVALVYFLGRRYEEAIAKAREVLALDSSFVQGHHVLGVAYLYVGRHEEAIAELKVAAAATGDAYDIGSLGAAYARAGRRAEALEVAEEMRVRWEQGADAAAVGLAMLHAGLGEREEALDWLERAYERRHVGLIALPVEPAFDGLRGEPRFQALVQKLGLGDS